VAAKSSTDGVCSSRIVREMPLSMSAFAMPSRYKACISGAEGDRAWPPKPAIACQWWELPRARALAQPLAVAVAVAVADCASWVWE